MTNLTSISVHAGSTSLLHSEVDGSDYFTGVRVRLTVPPVQVLHSVLSNGYSYCHGTLCF